MPTENVIPTSQLQKRASNIQNWLRENGKEAIEEQKHLDAGTQEQIYWHYGYLSALKDIIS